MAKGFSLPFLADVSGFLKGTRNMSDALEDVADSLDDVGKNKAGDKLEDGLKSAAKEAERLEKKSSDAFKSIAADARSAGKRVGSDVKDGTDKAAAGMDDLKSESASTAKETAASFSSIEDAGGAVQEVLANAFVGFGPAGMAAGLLAAAGVGLLISSATSSAEKIGENKEKMLALAQTIKDNGGTLTAADYVQGMEDYGYAIQDAKEWFEIFQTDAVSGFEKLRKLAEDTGLSTADIFKGGFGNKDEAVRTLELVQDKLEALREKKEAVYNTTGSILDPVDNEALTSLEESERLIQDNIKAQEDAAVVEQERRRAIEGSTEALKEDLAAIEQRTDALKGGITSELDYLDGIAELTETLKENGDTVDLNSQKGRDNRRAILDQASAIEEMAVASVNAGGSVADVTGKFQAQKDALITQVTPAFGGSREAARLYIEQILKTPPTVKTTASVEGVPQARAELEALAKSPIMVPMRPDYKPSYFQSVLDQMSNLSVPVTLRPRNGIGNDGP